jgi:hypothetical protein
MLSRAGNFVSSLIRKNLYPYGITPQFLHPLSADLLLDEFPKTAKRTKTVCTIGYFALKLDPEQNTPTTLSNLSMRG